MYVRSNRFPLGRLLSPRLLRAVIAAIYVLYPLGCIVQIAAPAQWGRAPDVIGFIMVAASLIALAVLAGSAPQRQTQEVEHMLDERERAERNRAAYVAYSMFSGLVLIGVLYLLLASDLAAAGKANLWIPRSGDHWSAIFWGLLLASLTLPTAVLAWNKTPPPVD